MALAAAFTGRSDQPPDQTHTFSEIILKTFSATHRRSSEPQEAIGELVFSLALETFERVAAACHRHQHGLARTPHLGSNAVRPVEVGRHQAQPLRAACTSDRRRGEGEVQRDAKPPIIDRAWQTERSADVLLMDHVVGEGDASAEPRRQPMRFGVRSDQRDQVRRSVVGVVVDAHLVDPVDPQPTLEETANQRAAAQFVEADRMRGDLADVPPLTQRRRLPLLRRQRLEKCGEIFALASGQVQPGISYSLLLVARAQSGNSAHTVLPAGVTSQPQFDAID